MLKRISRNLILYCIASLTVVGVILLNAHNEKFSNFNDYHTMTVNEEYEIPSDIGRYTDESAGFEGVFAKSGWFYMPNTGRFDLMVFADTRSETNRMELWVSDGRSETLVVSAQLLPENIVNVAHFHSMPSAKYAEIRVVFGGEGYLNVKHMEVYSDRAFNDTYITAVFAAICLLGFGLFTFLPKENTPLFETERNRMVDYVVLLAAVAFISQPLLLNYILFNHDDSFHLSRIEGIKDALLGGQFPVRNYIGSALGYGYAAPLYYPDLFLYIPAALRIFGASQTFAYNAFLFLINIVTAFVSYHAANRLFRDRFMALAASLLYTTALYRLINLYLRGALGEVIAMIFFPLIAAGLYEVFFGDRRRWWMLMVGFTGVIQSHILSILMILLFSVLFGIVFAKKLFREKRWWSLLKAAFATLSVNLWFLVPLLQMYTGFVTNFEVQHVNSYTMSSYLSQIFAVFVNASGYVKGLGGEIKGEMAQSIGLSLTLGMALLFFWYALRKRTARFERDERIATGALLFGLLAIWMSSYHFPLRAVVESGAIGELLNKIQYPWRFLVVVTLCLSFAGAVALARVGGRFQSKQLVLLVMAVVIAVPQGYFLYRVQEESGAIPRTEPVLDILVNYREYLPMDFLPLRDELLARSRAPVYQNPAMYTVESNDSNKEYVLRYGGGAGEVDLPMIYYPGYTAWDEDGKELTVTHNPGMYLRVVTEKSEGTVTVRYTGLSLWRVLDIVSFISVLLLVGLAVTKGVVSVRRKKGKAVVST